MKWLIPLTLASSFLITLAVLLRRLNREGLGAVSAEWVKDHQRQEHHGGVDQSGIQEGSWPIDKLGNGQGWWNAHRLKVGGERK